MFGNVVGSELRLEFCLLSRGSYRVAPRRIGKFERCDGEVV